ncbi:MAG TPA: patatin-like phospholipase family protein [Planctomycetota bacterium]|nr:patatin-like phospholipase family protein [Planctomycetota bacterium]
MSETPSTAGAPAASAREGLTLVLGGGGFKGLAHLGVLRVLQAEELPVGRVVGTSVGALLGATYCHFGDAESALDHVRRFLASEGFRPHSMIGFRRRPGRLPLVHRLMAGIRRQVALERIFRRSSAFGGGALRTFVRHLVPRADIADLRVPLAVCALDLRAGQPVLLSRGDLRTAVTASAAVPGFFPPVEWEGSLLCDAGIVDNLPTAAARAAGAVRLVAIDLSHSLGALRPTVSGMEILLYAQEVSTRLANASRAGAADIVLRPELDGRHWLDTSQLDTVIDAGERAARQALPSLRALLERPVRRPA